MYTNEYHNEADNVLWLWYDKVLLSTQRQVSLPHHHHYYHVVQSDNMHMRTGRPTVCVYSSQKPAQQRLSNYPSVSRHTFKGSPPVMGTWRAPGYHYRVLCRSRLRNYQRIWTAPSVWVHHIQRQHEAHTVLVFLMCSPKVVCNDDDDDDDD